VDQSNRVDFYILTTPGQSGRMRFACKLTEKAYRMNLRIHAVVPDRSSAEYLDRLLWTFRQGSFVPHEILGTGKPSAPVTIATAAEKPPDGDLLINLCDDLDEAVQSYSRVAEIVGAAPDEVANGRVRYRTYREKGFQIETHEIGGQDG
jgi:DNA polymerase-3 subunit chi